MSENKGSGETGVSLTRKIGVGLTRTNLSPSKDVSQRSPRDRPLLTPSRLIISGSSLGTGRTNSDSYSSGYNRLGGLKNISAPNVSSNLHASSSVNRPLKTISSVDKTEEPTLRKNLSATNTTDLLKNERVFSGVSVQRSHSANRGPFDYKFSQPDRAAELTAYKAPDNVQVIHDKSETSTTKIENYDLDLEQDEEDAVVEVKDTVDGPGKICAEYTSPSSPSKDSGYSSPRTDPNMETFNTSVLGSRSPVQTNIVESSSPSDIQSNLDNFTYKPERPVRSKHSAKKKSLEQPMLLSKNSDQSQQLSQITGQSVTLSQTSTKSPWQQENVTSKYDTPVTSILRNDPLNSNSDLSSKDHLKGSVSEESDKGQESGSQGQESRSHFEVTEGDTPTAKPRIHRKRTRRSISFRHLVRKF